jgi:hypothetical protein
LEVPGYCCSAQLCFEGLMEQDICIALKCGHTSCISNT